MVLPDAEDEAAEKAFRDSHPEFRGKEICVTMHSYRGAYHLTPDQYKQLMLLCWKALYDEGVTGIGYALPSKAVFEIPSHPAVTHPFSFSTQQRKGPVTNPLAGVIIRPPDLASHHLPQECSDTIFSERLCYQGDVGTQAGFKAATQELETFMLYIHKEINCLKDLIEIMKDTPYWVPKHRTKQNLPEGIRKFQALIQ